MIKIFKIQSNHLNVELIQLDCIMYLIFFLVVRLEFGGTDLCCEGAGLTEEIINLG